MPSDGRTLTTTSYAILGMLAIRPWSAYELTRQMRRSLDYCWPKAESVLYDEPKRLVEDRLATVRHEPVGGRTRAVYRITAKGRRALADWLATDPGPPKLEIEGLVRLLYADHGTAGDVLGSIRSMRLWAEERSAAGRAQVEGYLTDGGPFPERLHIGALFASFFAEFFQLVVGWATAAEAEIQTWPRTAGLGMTETARGEFERIFERRPPTWGRWDGTIDPVSDGLGHE